MSAPKRVVFSGIDSVPEWKLENYLVTVRKHLMCPNWARNCNIDTTGYEAASVTFVIAVAKVREALKTGLTECPLREVVDRAVSIGGVKLSVGGATCHSKGETMNFKVAAGYFVPEGRIGDVMDNWVADAVAFQHTPLSKKDVGVIDNAVTPKIEKSLHLAEQSFTVGLPQEWTTDAVMNSDGLLALFKTPKFLQQSVLHGISMSEKWQVHGDREVIKAAPEVMAKTYTIDNRIFVSMPCAVLQNSKVPVEEKSFYKDLAIHRSVRGADKNSRNRMSTGYYLGSMSRALDQQLWQSIDLLNAMQMCGKTNIYFPTKPNFNVVNTLLANEMKVHVFDMKNLGETKFKVYRQAPPKFNNGLAYIAGFFGEQSPTINKKNLLIGQLHEEFVTEFKAFMALDGLVFTHVYLRDYHFEYLEYLYPSVHAHAGHALLCNTTIHDGKAFDIRYLFARAAMANKYKTAFPVRRVTFATQDKFCPRLLKEEGIVIGTIVEDSDYSAYGDVDAEADFHDAFQAPAIAFTSKTIVSKPIASIIIIPTAPEIEADEEKEEKHEPYNDDDHDAAEDDEEKGEKGDDSPDEYVQFEY